MAVDPDKMHSMAEAASILGISVKTLRAHVMGGRIRTVKVGTTKKRPRRKIVGQSINSFIRKQKERQSCPSTKAKILPATSTTSNSTVVAFTDLQAQRAKEKLKASKVISSAKPGSKPVRLKFTKAVP